MATRTTWGLAGLLAFEAIIAAYVLSFGATTFALMYAIGAVTLALAIWRGPTRWHYAVLAAASLYRAWLQTRDGAALGIWPTYLVPLGFAWLAIAPATAPRFAIASVAVSRTWFILWYFLAGNPVVAAANILGAAGAWLWASDAAAPASATFNDEPRVAPP